MTDGATDLSIGIDRGRVRVDFPSPVTWIALDPQNAFEIGEAIARAAHKARFGTDAPSDSSYVAAQVKARVTEQRRDMLIITQTRALQSMLEQKRTPGYMAMTIIDAVLNEAT